MVSSIEEDCLIRLLKGEGNEHHLPIVLEFYKTDDLDLILRVYNALPNRFSDCLLRDGMVEGSTAEERQDNHDYLKVFVTFLVVFCRVSSIASSDDMVNKIPLILEIIYKDYRIRSPLAEKCLEFLYLVSTAHSYGVQIFYKYGGMTIIRSQMPDLPQGSRTRELARKLLQLTISKLSLDTIIKEYCSQLSPVEQQASSIEDILKLLKGERDEQRLAGLLLATKFCENGDSESILRVYNAGNTFLDHLLHTGMGKGSTTDNRQDNQDAYLKLSLTILVAFVRVSSITSLDDMVNKIPIILEILSKELGPPLVEECLEILYLVLTTHNCGVEIYYKAGGLTIIRPHMSNSPQGSCTRELATKLFEFTLMHISMDTLKKEYRLALSSHEQQGSSIEDILKLLKGELDEQRLVGLLLATKFCRNDDSESILRVYNVGNTFLDRLLQTGMGKGSTTENHQDAYLRLSLTILAAFVRVSSIASSDDMVNKIPLILEILSKELEPPLVEECLEILYLVLTSHSCGVEILYKAGGLTVINVHMSNLPEGSRTRELATKLLKFTLCHISMDALKKELCLALSRDATKVEAKLIDHMDLYRKLISTKVDDGDENNLGSRIEELLRVLHDLVSQLQASVSSEGLEIYSHTLTRHQEIHHDLSQAFNRLRSGLRAKRKFDRNIRQLVASVCTFLFLIYWSS